jgi:hypothetical protein
MIITEMAAEADMVHLKIEHTAAVLTPPSISLKDALA